MWVLEDRRGDLPCFHLAAPQFGGGSHQEKRRVRRCLRCRPSLVYLLLRKRRVRQIRYIARSLEQDHVVRRPAPLVLQTTPAASHWSQTFAEIALSSQKL